MIAVTQYVTKYCNVMSVNLHKCSHTVAEKGKRLMFMFGI